MDLETFDDVIASIEKNKNKRLFHLLLGNGFSMAYDSKIFSYNALHEFVSKAGNSLLTDLFDTIKTKNFEEVMRHLENFSALVDVFGTDEKLKEKVKAAETELKAKLLEAIKSLHPEHVFKVPQEKSDQCGSFLRWKRLYDKLRFVALLGLDEKFDGLLSRRIWSRQRKPR
jgi:hypothetical protein